MAQLQFKVGQVKNQMADNIGLALKNTDTIEDIDKSAEHLAISAKGFEDNSRRLKRAAQCRRYKMIAMIVFIVLVILAVIAGIIASNFVHKPS